MSMIGNCIAIDPAALECLVADPERIPSFIYPEGADAASNRLDIDKAWHAIHFTLNGRVWAGDGALGLVILGGEEVGENFGYGPARYLTPDQVSDAATALSKVSSDAFSQRFDPAALDEAEIHPQTWVRDDKDGLSYVQVIQVSPVIPVIPVVQLLQVIPRILRPLPGRQRQRIRARHRFR